MANYSEKLRDPRWQKKRLEILSRDEFTCKLCGDKETELQVHHKEYKYGSEPWEYQDENFITYCKDCHGLVEYWKKLNVWKIESVIYKEEYEIFAVISALDNDINLSIIGVFDRNTYSSKLYIQNHHIHILVKNQNLING